MPQYKTYGLEKSPFFKVKSKRKLCGILNTSLRVLENLTTQENYWIYDHINPNNKKVRRIYAPKPETKRIQKRFQELLSRISTPQYLFSGKKNTCYIDNAEYHRMSMHAITIDIREFYTSARKEYIFKFFKYHLQMADDVAWLLADITTYNIFFTNRQSCKSAFSLLGIQRNF